MKKLIKLFFICEWCEVQLYYSGSNSIYSCIVTMKINYMLLHILVYTAVILCINTSNVMQIFYNGTDFHFIVMCACTNIKLYYTYSTYGVAHLHYIAKSQSSFSLSFYILMHYLHIIIYLLLLLLLL